MVASLNNVLFLVDFCTQFCTYNLININYLNKSKSYIWSCCPPPFLKIFLLNKFSLLLIFAILNPINIVSLLALSYVEAVGIDVEVDLHMFISNTLDCILISPFYIVFYITFIYYDHEIGKSLPFIFCMKEVGFCN